MASRNLARAEFFLCGLVWVQPDGGPLRRASARPQKHAQRGISGCRLTPEGANKHRSFEFVALRLALDTLHPRSTMACSAPAAVAEHSKPPTAGVLPTKW